MKDALADVAPMKRAGLPLDIAECALWLAGDSSSFVNGQAIAVDGTDHRSHLPQLAGAHGVDGRRPGRDRQRRGVEQGRGAGATICRSGVPPAGVVVPGGFPDPTGTRGRWPTIPGGASTRSARCTSPERPARAGPGSGSPATMPTDCCGQSGTQACLQERNEESLIMFNEHRRRCGTIGNGTGRGGRRHRPGQYPRRLVAHRLRRDRGLGPQPHRPPVATSTRITGRTPCSRNWPPRPSPAGSPPSSTPGRSRRPTPWCRWPGPRGRTSSWWGTRA